MQRNGIGACLGLLVSLLASGAAASSGSVTVSSPGSGATVVNPVRVKATASADVPISQLQIWDNGNKLGVSSGSAANLLYSLAPGGHAVTVLALDDSFNQISGARTTVNYTVAAAASGSVSVTSPASGATVTSPVRVQATASADVPISQLQAWDNGVKLGVSSGSAMDFLYSLAPGSHQLSVLALDDAFNDIPGAKTIISYTVAAAASGSVSVTAPASGATVVSPVRVRAAASADVPISQLQAWDNGVKLGVSSGSAMDFLYSLAPGSHQLSVLALDDAFNDIPGAKTIVSYTVAAAASGSVSVTSPASAATVNSPVRVAASASADVPISQLQVWDNGVKLGVSSGSSVDSLYTLAPGAHQVTVLALDESFDQIPNAKAIVNYTVAAPPSGSVSVTSPASGATVTSPVRLTAAAQANVPISQLQAWDNGVKLGVSSGSAMDLLYSLTPGAHQTTVLALDASFNQIPNATAVVSYTVTAGPNGSVAISAPAAGATVTGGVRVTASATANVAINQVQVWDNGAKLGWYAGSSVDQTYALAPGAHQTTVLALDNSYNQIPNAAATVSYVVSASSGGTGGGGPSTSLAGLTANDTSASPLFDDLYYNYATAAISSNGDNVPGPTVVPLARGLVSKLPVQDASGDQQVLVETQQWFCHLASNEDATKNPVVMKSNPPKCGSHIDIGYNSDDPAIVHRQVSDMISRGINGVIMDWSGKQNNSNVTYPTTTTPPTNVSRGSPEISTNAGWALRKEVESRSGFTFAVTEDEGITNCAKGWAGGCQCLTLNGVNTCNATTQVISDLNYIYNSWGVSSAYQRQNGKPVVYFFDPDGKGVTIDWATVQANTPAMAWIFENAGGFTHYGSGGAFAWLSVTPYPGSDSSYGINAQKWFDSQANANAPAGALRLSAAYKGFDDAAVNGWGGGTRYIDQRCGQTWLDSLALSKGAFTSGPSFLQLETWDDYEEGTEIETGIDNCVSSLSAEPPVGNSLSWSIAFGKSVTGTTGSENSIDHYEIYASSDGVDAAPIGTVARDINGNLSHSFDLSAAQLPAGSYQVYVEAVGKPVIVNHVSNPEPFVVGSGQQGSVAGTVIDAKTGAAIIGATVSCGGSSARTGASGAYSIGGLPSGAVTCTAAAASYSSEPLSVTVPAGGTASADFSLAPAVTGAGYSSKHVFVLMLENRSDAEALQYMPYLSGLASQYSQSLQAYSPSHGSFLAYLEVAAGVAPVSGGAVGGQCNGDGCSPTTAYTGDSVVHELLAKSMTWRGYFQTMPSAGYMGYQSGLYVRRHNPFPFIPDVYKSAAQQQNMVPWTTNLASDLAAGNVANYTWLVPDLTHDGHDGSTTQLALSNADAYLSSQLPALLSSKYFQPGGDGVLLVTFDESDLYGDNSCSSTVSKGCGGHIFFALIGPNVKRAYKSSTHLMQDDMLKGTCDLLGLAACPGDGASAAGLGEFFIQTTLGVSYAAPPAVTGSGLTPSVTPQALSASLGSVYLTLSSNDPALPAAPLLSAQIGLPSGVHNVSLTRLASGDYYSQLSTASFAPQDFSIDGSTLTVSIGSATLTAVGTAGMVLPSLGGVVQDATQLATVILPPNALSGDTRVQVQAEPPDAGNQRSQALSRQDLKQLGPGRQIELNGGAAQISSPASLVLPFDPSQIPSGRSLSDVRIAYFNPSTGLWELQSSAMFSQASVQATVQHFSLYAPVVLMPQSAPGLHDAYVYPDPALPGQDPVIRAELGLVDTVNVTIFDVSGRVVSSGILPGGAASGILNGHYYYDYPWTGPKASGVYFAVVHGKASDGSIVKARARFAVVR